MNFFSCIYFVLKTKNKKYIWFNIDERLWFSCIIVDSFNLNIILILLIKNTFQVIDFTVIFRYFQTIICQFSLKVHPPHSRLKLDHVHSQISIINVHLLRPLYFKIFYPTCLAFPQNNLFAIKPHNLLRRENPIQNNFIFKDDHTLGSF